MTPNEDANGYPAPDVDLNLRGTVMSHRVRGVLWEGGYSRKRPT